ncbi:low molecular weight phosphotyrosine protein phosphatase, putative [Trichomonas vaginalis G3]|uniref:Low molecular weight phosphotyrosine protein phosphatase, putative n=1 Tax=Trichomonas vaginalis (strain ATCC PRA-98 / G3) TaxID=412133 RepID=A2F3J7_TRIV3|nr:non-membrane spanning protein tyrosine phosphatase protein [Trichomonas vaginalis G3]EAY00520.1 low molecular weight phosphotyrosine protein phosphatase, putative [Trichomonas vaginalis G3]KAI5550189.1 non-membrane spanning protein tyrosine phosphatase protein [Trichomonas vaginalis G3]|eukprot:XP_001313449.1 low molecular weight phosphotyrosine protein phosphatase [Trichomonas vaginalis G3]
MQNKSVLFVCTGNICRSPACEAICQKLTNGSVMVDSAAISSHHRNESPDERTQAICLKHNVDISQHRARQIRADDWLLFDFVVALDENIYKTLIQMKPINSKAQVLLYAPPHGIHDPYFGGRTGFSKMYQDIVSTMPEFLKQNNIYSMQNSSISL